MSEELAEKKIKTTTEQCPSCGSGVSFDAASGQLKCSSCGSIKNFDREQGLEKHDYESGETANNAEWSETTRTFQCKTCGAKVDIKGFDTTIKCPYCESLYVEEVKEWPNLKPDFVVPFKYGFKEIVDIFTKAAKKKFFAPSQFKKNIPSSSVKGYYVSSFMFDAETHSSYVGTVEHVYYTTDSNGNSHRHVQVLPIAGKRDDSFSNEIISSSHFVTDKNLDSITPFSLDDAYRYNENFLRGYNAAHYAKSLDDCYLTFKSNMDKVIRNKISSTYATDRILTLSVDTLYEDKKYTYALFPVYTFEFQYKGKQYLAYVNGQTGKLGRGVPISGLKVFICVLIGLAIVAGIVVGVIMALK